MSGRVADDRVARAFTSQKWADLTFLHWRFEPSDVQALLPPGLHADVLDGSAWVALVPFSMQDVRLAPVPGRAVWREFPEFNVRTYVHSDDGHDGVWFFRLFTPRHAFNSPLRSFGIPYRFAQARVAGHAPTITYGFRRRSDTPGHAMFVARVEIGEPLDAKDRTPLLDSLTGRWNAYAHRAGLLWRLPVEHEPWPLYDATATARRWPLTDFGLPEPQGEPVVHFSPGVRARFGLPKLVGRPSSGP